MKRISLLSFAGLSLAFALACTGGSETPPPPPPPTPEAPPTPVATVEAPPATPAPAPGEIGVPACDKYISDLSACVGKLDAVARPAIESGLNTTRESWKTAASNPTAKASLEATCAAMVIPPACAAAAGAGPMNPTATPAATPVATPVKTEPVRTSPVPTGPTSLRPGNDKGDGKSDGKGDGKGDGKKGDDKKGGSSLH